MAVIRHTTQGVNMAEEKTGNVAPEKQDQKETVTKAEYDDLKQRLETIMKAQAGSDRRVTELSKLLEDSQKKAVDAEKTAEEKVLARIAGLEETARKNEAMAQKAQRDSAIRELAGKYEIPKSSVTLALTGQLGLEEVEQNFKDAQEEFKTAVNTKANTQLGSNTFKPGSGVSGVEKQPATQAEWNERAQKRMDAANKQATA